MRNGYGGLERCMYGGGYSRVARGVPRVVRWVPRGARWVPRYTM